MNKIDAAWLAGLYEGEGTVVTVNKYYPQLRIKMADRDVLTRALEITGAGNVRVAEKPRAANHKQMHVWTVGKRDDIISICHAMWDHLGERRREQIQRVVTYFIREPV